MSFSVGNVDVSNFPPTLTSQQRLVSLSKLANFQILKRKVFERIIWTYFQENNNIKFNGLCRYLPENKVNTKTDFCKDAILAIYFNPSLENKFCYFHLSSFGNKVNSCVKISQWSIWYCTASQLHLPCVIPPTFRNTLKCQNISNV